MIFCQRGKTLHPRQKLKRASIPAANKKRLVRTKRAVVHFKREHAKSPPDIQNPIFMAKIFGPALTFFPEIPKIFWRPRAINFMGEVFFKKPLSPKSKSKKRGMRGAGKKYMSRSKKLVIAAERRAREGEICSRVMGQPTEFCFIFERVGFGGILDEERLCP